MKKLLVTALLTLVSITSAYAQSAACGVKVDVKKEAVQLLGAALEKEGALTDDLLRHKVNAIKWHVSKEGSPCPTELTIEGNLEFSVQNHASVCDYVADVTKIAFRGGDGTLPRFIVNSKPKGCSSSVANK